jgi:sialate O-acetylesterase
MKRTVNIAIALAVCVLAIGSPALADVTVPTIFGDNMVLQRDVELPVWGQADAGEKITVTMCGKTATAAADKDGAWAVKLPAMKCTPKQTGLTMTIKGANTITLKNILIGEVWVGSGQSNMEWSLSRSTGGKEAIAKADLPNIRLYHVPKTQSKTPNKDIKAAWKVCSPKTCDRFSGVLFFFGQRLHNELKIPIGLINSSWGGSPIEPWTVTDASKKQGGGMYNAMIAPLQPFSVRGAIWYQGETNVMRKNGLKYFDKKKALIEGWRKTWNNDKLSFYTVQIAPWAGRYAPGELPKLWEAQVASLKLPGTGLAVITDLVDNIKDIHPQNKLPVGNRLALWALVKDYGKTDLVYSGPLYKSMKIEGAKIRVSFAHATGGLAARDGKDLNEFQIAGADGAFVPAKAVIDGETVVVSADGVKAPKSVRFGWHKVANPNLINKAKLPASPFQTDNWTGGTGE